MFRDWLSDAIPTSGLSKREIARRMAAKHPRGVNLNTIETGRRTLNKILAGDLTPTQPTRDSIAEALGRDDAPAVTDEDDEESDLSSTLQALAREQAELSRRLSRALKAVGA
jgi:transcriptional regulator with XRE-family HTH domain